jgi:surface antigen
MRMQKSWCEPAGKKYGKSTSAKKYRYGKRFACVKATSAVCTGGRYLYKIPLFADVF